MLNKYLTKENLIIVLLIYLIGSGFFSSSEGISPEEELYRLKIHDLNQEKALLLKKNNQLEFRYEEITRNIHSDSLIIWSADRDKRDSIRSAINPG